jgi:hypothetical protein
VRLGGSRAQFRKVALVEHESQPAAAGCLDQASRLLEIVRTRRLNTRAGIAGRTDVDTDEVRPSRARATATAAARPMRGRHQ